LDFSPEMVARLRARAAEVEVLVGDGQALPFEEGRFDAAFSMFGLMFFPDRHAGLTELHRALRPGGRALVASWVEVREIPVLAAALGAFLQAVGGSSSPPQRPGLSCEADVRAELEAAGFVEVEVQRHTLHAVHDGPAELVAWMARCMAPIVLARRQLGEERFAEVQARWVELVERGLGGGEIVLPFVALFGMGRRAGG